MSDSFSELLLCLGSSPVQVSEPVGTVSLSEAPIASFFVPDNTLLQNMNKTKRQL